jgi:hypothetical protein
MGLGHWGTGATATATEQLLQWQWQWQWGNDRLMVFYIAAQNVDNSGW